MTFLNVVRHSWTIHFNEDKVEALHAFLLRKNGIALPDHLVYYDDESIGFEEDADSLPVSQSFQTFA